MFYSNNDGYMQDLNYYNQYPGMRYNQYNQNPYMNNSYMQQIQAMNMTQPETLSNMYPNIYKVVYPVVSKVLNGTNYQYITEDNLNNMVDTIYNIVEGQVDLENDTEDKYSTSEMRTNLNNSSQNSRAPGGDRNNMSTSTNVNNSNSTPNFNSNNGDSNYSRRNAKTNSVFRDLIKVLLIREILSRRNSQFPMQQNSYHSNQPNFYPPMYM